MRTFHNYLVTGGAGFIGSHFIELLFEKYGNKINVTNLDKLTYAGRLENTTNFSKRKNYKFVKGDIANRQLVCKLLKKADVIVNFAAETHVDRSIKKSDSFVRTDILGTNTLLEESLKAKIKLFLHVSTDEVYGQALKGSFTEITPLRPRNPYSASKAGADMLVMSYFITHNLPVIVTRSSNNYGPRQFPEKVIPLFITRLFKGKKVPLFGDGKHVRDWLYVKDNCEAIELVTKKGTVGEVYNIGGSHEIQNIELTKQLIKLCGRDSSYIQKVADREGHDRRYSLDTRKVKRLGWKPKIKFSVGIKKTVEWYRKNYSNL